jgi:SAM-dependent methyltransferase
MANAESSAAVSAAIRERSTSDDPRSERPRLHGDGSFPGSIDADTTPSVGTNEDQQRRHFDEIQDAYEAHYDDDASQAYRRRFLYEPLLAGIDLRGRTVLEAMSGSGQATGYLQERGADVTGLDISARAVESFRRRWPQSRAVEGSILETGFPDASFDCVVVIGGLHHVHPHVDAAIDEIARVLRPGGWFCFGEPHARSLPDLVRRAWYRRDAMFAEGEEAVDIDEVERRHARDFEFAWKRFMGNAAYLLVLNSMVFRVPLKAKRVYAPLLAGIETMLQPLQRRSTSCFALCRWRRR